MARDYQKIVQGLLDKAFNEATPEPEKVALMAKAEELMLEHAISVLDLADPNRPNTAFVMPQKPEIRVVTIYGSNLEYEVTDTLGGIWRALAQHFRIRQAPHVGGLRYGEARVFGFPADLDFFEMMYQHVQIYMISTMYPTMDPSKDLGTNIASFKQAGYKWPAIHLALHDHPAYADRKDKVWTQDRGPVEVGRPMYNIYKKWLKDNGIKDRQVTEHPDVWRRSFMDGFRLELKARLQDMRRRVLENDSKLPALLDDVKSQLDEAFYDMFPDQRPHPPECECDVCHFQKCVDRSCIRPRCKQYWANEGKPVRYRKGPPPPAMSMTAMARGRQAAHDVDLTSPQRKVGGTRGEIG